jgi:hypothetical protein
MAISTCHSDLRSGEDWRVAAPPLALHGMMPGFTRIGNM